MPRVPSYDQFQVDQSAVGTVPIRAPQMPDVAGDTAQRVSQGLAGLSRATGDIANETAARANAARVDDATTQLVKMRTDLQVQALNLRGKDALERPDNKSLADEYTEKLDEHARDLAQSLGNDMQRQAFARQATALRGQFYGALSSHMMQQQNEYQDQTEKAKIETAQNQAGLLWGDAVIRQQSQRVITDTVNARADRSGWSPEMRDDAMRDAMSPMHASIINGMIKAGNASDAKKYYDENSANMTLQARSAILPAVTGAEQSQLADNTVTTAWQKFAPLTMNDPVRLYDMEQQIRDDLKDKPDALKMAISGLRERAQAFNAQQSELNAKAVNSVFGLIDSGMTMAQVRRSDAWLALPEEKRHDISKAIENEAYTRTLRAEAEDRRGAARLAMEDRLLLRNNADSYLADSDPATLANATRDQVAALRTKYGLEATEHLLSKWDSLHRPDNKIDLTEARMDDDSFKRIGADFGYNTYAPKSQNDKEQLGTLKYRIERVLAAEQQQAGRKLTEGDKEAVMRREFSDAAKVTVDGRLWGSDQVPVIQLDAGKASRVAIPQADRDRIAQKMSARYQSTQDPRFAPTEENLRYWYLMSKSPTAATIPAAK